LCLGSFSKESPLQSALEKIRVAEQDNGSLDKVAKKMRAREKRFGCDWYFQGHHPQEDYAALEQGTAPLSFEGEASSIHIQESCLHQ
jgi:hypothetical protein